jgi:hypothetical protein
MGIKILLNHSRICYAIVKSYDRFNPMTNIYYTKHYKTHKIPRKFYAGLCELLHKLGIDGNDVVEDFINEYVNYSYKKTKTKAAVYLSTGFSRYIVQKYLNTNKHYIKRKKKNTYYLLLLDELKILSDKFPDGLIPIYGKFGSYTSAFNNTKSSENIITSKSMLENLINAGIIEKKGSNVRFLTTLPTKALLNSDSVINTLSDLMHRMCKTIYHNINSDSNDDTLFQMSYSSVSIIPEKRNELTDKLRELARKHYREYQKLIDSYEEKETSRKKVEYSNNEIGISTFIFNNDNEE